MNLREGFVIGALGLSQASCSTTTPTATTVYQSLVEAGCLAPSADGPASIAAEHIRADQPTWLACLWAGGNVKSCSVPCL